MTVYSLFPSYVQIYYHTSNAPHTMIIPTNQWHPGDVQGFFDGWDFGERDADTMINDFIADWADLFTSNTTFDYYTIFNYAEEESLPQAVAFGELAVPGTVSPTGANYIAVQATISWKCDNNSILKTVGMDAVAPDNFQKVLPLGLTTFIPDIIAEVTGVSNAWRSRAGGLPLFGLQAAFTLNEKLRRSYHEN